MAAYVVIAEFAVVVEHRAEFLELCKYDGTRSVADEPGCSQFDVITTVETPDAVILYEVYDDRAAFDAHLTMPHYKVFAEGLERLGVAKTQVRFFERMHP
jgi:autoinducer 2-degrading protein